LIIRRAWLAYRERKQYRIEKAKNRYYRVYRSTMSHSNVCRVADKDLAIIYVIVKESDSEEATKATYYISAQVKTRTDRHEVLK